jgi:hypothetical protein
MSKDAASRMSSSLEGRPSVKTETPFSSITEQLTRPRALLLVVSVRFSRGLDVDSNAEMRALHAPRG